MGGGAVASTSYFKFPETPDAFRRCSNIAQPPGILFSLSQEQINVA